MYLLHLYKSFKKRINLKKDKLNTFTIENIILNFKRSIQICSGVVCFKKLEANRHLVHMNNCTQ